MDWFKVTYILINFRFKIISGVRARAESYEIWVDKVKEALEAKGDERLDFDDIKELLEESQTRKYPESELLEALTATVEEADKCQTVANQLGNKKVCIFFYTLKVFISNLKWKITVRVKVKLSL